MRLVDHILQLIVSVYGIQQIHQLTFVFVNTLHHDIEEYVLDLERTVRVQVFLLSLLLNPFQESPLILGSNVEELFKKI